MSVGLGLLHRLLSDNRSVTVLHQAGIREEDLADKELEVYQELMKHTRLYSSIPNIETIERETGVDFPDFPAEPLGYWIDKVTRRSRIRLILAKTKDAQDYAGEGSVDDAEEVLQALWTELSTKRQGEHVHRLADLLTDVVTDHDVRQMRSSMAGIPFGLPYLDGISDGAQPGDTIALVGRPGTGKTYLCLLFASFAYTLGGSPLVATLEMTPKQVARRVVALRSHVPATRVRLGRLSHWGRDQMLTEISSLREVGGDRPFWIYQGSLNSTVEDLASWVRDLRPSALYVDGAYLLRTRQDFRARWERVTYTAEYLKGIAGDYNIPVIETYQFNRRGSGSLANIAYSDAIPQLASIVMGLEDETKARRGAWSGRFHRTLNLLKGREGERGKLRLLFDMNRMEITQEMILDGLEEGLQVVEDEVQYDERRDR